MKKMLVALLIAVLAVSAFGSPYAWESAPICGNKTGTDDSLFVNAEGFGLPYGVAVAGNGRVWTSSYYSTNRYRKAILVYDPVYEAIDTVGPEIVDPDGVADTLGSCRFMEATADGNVAFGDWTNDRIRVFDQESYACIAQSPGPDDEVFPVVSGGMATFAYDGEQYYCSQPISGSTVVIWDAAFNVVDTLTGGGGGRNMAANKDGSKIWSPSLGGTYIVEYSGNPDDGYAKDTLTFEDLGLEMTNVVYISSGPNDYLWVMSRESKVDGIYVLDPEDDYSIKLSTVTDSSITSVDGFDLGMAVQKQWDIWLADGLIDSSDRFTTGGYSQPWVLRAPCQVDYSWSGNAADPEYLYVADFYGYTLKLFTRTTEVSTWNHTGYIGENGFKLNVAYPNPFNPSVTIPYELSSNGNVVIDIFDLSGKKVANLVDGYKFAGNYEVRYDAGDLASGNYLVKMTVGNRSVSQKISLVK